MKTKNTVVCTILGVVSAILAPVLAVKATTKATKIIEKTEEETGLNLTKAEVVKSVWKCYIPTATAMIMSVTCVVGAEIINHKQQISLVSAYALLEQTYKQYHNKVKDILGFEKAEELQNDSFRKAENPSNQEGLTDYRKRTFYDTNTSRYFESTIEEIQDAEYALNRKMALEGSVSLNDWCDLIGLPKIADGDDVGWSLGAGLSLYGYQWIEFEHVKSTIAGDGMECYIINTPFTPTPDYLEE